MGFLEQDRKKAPDTDHDFFINKINWPVNKLE